MQTEAIRDKSKLPVFINLRIDHKYFLIKTQGQMHYKRN